MGSVFRKTAVRPVPAGADIITGQGRARLAKWTPKGVRRPITAPVVTRADGAEFVHVETGCYYASYRDHNNKLRTVTTRCKDKDNAKRFLDNLEKQRERVDVGVISKEEARRVDTVKTTSIEAHIADYVATLTGSESHRQHTESYLENLKSELGWSTLADLQRDGLELWLADQFNKKERSARSCNGYRIAASGFCTWLVGAKRLASNPFSGLPKFDEEAGAVRPRRAFTADELYRLMDAARRAPARPGLKTRGKSDRPAERFSGADRADLYAFLAGTGLRIDEARQLRVSDLVLDSDLPGIDLRAGTTKNSEKGFIPLRGDLVGIVRRHVEGRRPGDPMFDIPADLIKRFHGDCKRGKIARLDDRGQRVDLHSLRKSFGTFLALAGVPLTVTQRLMRHSDPKLTSNIYTDLNKLDLHGAVSAMPPVGPKVVVKVVVTERTPLQISSTTVHQLQDEPQEKAAS
jgi:integrase